MKNLTGITSSGFALRASRVKPSPARGVVDIHVSFKGRAAFEFELEQVLLAPHRSSPAGSGYVVDCLWSARHAFLASAHFDEVVGHAIALGRDTDTTAAVAGGLAGVRAGASGLPKVWLESLALHPSLPGLLGVLSDRPA